MSRNRGPFGPFTYFALGLMLGGLPGGLFMIPIVTGILYIPVALFNIGPSVTSVLPPEFLHYLVVGIAAVIWAALLILLQARFPGNQPSAAAGRRPFRLGVIIGAVLAVALQSLPKGAA